MANMCNSEEEKNFFKVAKALTYIGTTLEKYTEAGLKRLHQNIYRKLANQPKCQTNCSEVMSKNFNRWCSACRRWRQELEASYRHKQRFQTIDWKQMKSWSWHDGPESIAEVFLPPGWAKDATKIDFKDLSTVLCLWNNCEEYNLSPNAIRKMREIRNFWFAHNSTMKIPDCKLTSIFNVLGVLLRDNDLGNFVNSQHCMQDLQRLKEINDNDLDSENLIKLSYKLTRLENEQQTHQEQLAFIRLYMSNHVPVKEAYSLFTKMSLTVGILILFIISCLTIWNLSDNRDIIRIDSARRTVCLTEKYSVPFTPELQLEGYLATERQFVGRKWLIDELEADLLSPDFKNQGILLIADIGYGKSALVSHLLCADEKKVGWQIKRRIMAYHVCKFDVLSTKNPALFIRRLVGMTANQIPEYGSMISLLPNTSIIFDRYLCEQDPNGCFDQGLLFPLMSLREPPKGKSLIIIDALDECADNLGGQNRISDFIRQRAEKLPPWIILLITSRNTSDIGNSKAVLVKHVFSSDQRNYDDIKGFLVKKKNKFNFRLRNMFGIASDEVLIDKLVNTSGGNFLFLTHAFEYWLSFNGTVEDIPSSLDRIYNLNFERIFGTDGNNFLNARLILEIICASFYPLQESELLHILEFRKTKYETESFVRQTLRQLSMFLKIENKVLMFTHISIRNWLLNEDNIMYRISLANGAKLLSDYLLEELQVENFTSNFSQLVLHVSRASNNKLEEKLRSITINKTQDILKMHVLHAIVDIVDSPKAIDLIVNHYKDIDHRDDKNLTASCIAASKGHVKSLKRLIELGADINITVPTNLPSILYYSFAELIVDYYKINHFPGYSLLHLASQFGQVPVVDFILRKEKSMMYRTNDFGYMPLHVGCEFGKVDVVERFLSFENMTDDLTCLYLASKNQHQSVVRFLLNRNVSRFQCISEKDANIAFESIIYFNRSDNLYVKINELVRPLDVWWKIKQDSPLHVSIRNGNFFIAMSIASAMPSFLKCPDGGGLTPFLTSIKYQRADIFKNLLGSGHLDVCTGPSQLIKKLGDIYNPIMETCTKGMTLTHFLGLSGDDEMIIHVIEEKIEVQFHVQDASGATPLHVAACSGNIKFLFAADSLRADFEITSNNGSTPYHSAVYCHSHVGLFVLNRIRGIPYLRDSLNRSLGLHLVLDPKGKKVNFSDTENDERDIHILSLLLNSNLEFLTNEDYNKRNIFHYALSNGHYHYVQFLLTTKPKISLRLLLQKDTFGETPVTYAINALRKFRLDLPVYNFPVKCPYTEVFLSQECLNANSLNQLMSPIELGLLYVMMYSDHIDVEIIFAKHFGNIILLSKMYLVPYFLLRIAHRINPLDLKRQVLYAVMRKPEPHNILTIVLYNPELLIHCDATFSGSPLHELLRHTDRIINALDVYANIFVRKMFQTKARKHILLHCLDRKGNTVIERAVEDKSLHFVKYLIDIYGTEFISTTKFNKLVQKLVTLNLVTPTHTDEIRKRQKIRQDIYKSSFLHQPIQNISKQFIASIIHHRIEDIKFTMLRLRSLVKNNLTKAEFDEIVNILTMQNFDREIIDDLSNTSSYLRTERTFWATKDELISKMLIKYKRVIDLDIFCSPGSVLFSLIHYLAASNMHKTVTVLFEQASFGILNCTTKHGVTPLYLAKVFKADMNVEILQSKLNMILPNKSFEVTLLFKLLSNFADSNTKEPLFFLQNNVPTTKLSNAHKVNVALREVVKAKRESNVYKYIYSKYFPLDLIKGIRYVYSVLSLTHNILAIEKDRMPCYRFKRHLAFYHQIIAEMMEDCTCLASRFRTYRYLWGNKTLFRNFEKCVVMKHNKVIFRAFHFFIKRLMAFLIKKYHRFLYNAAVKEVKMCFGAFKIFRKNAYFEESINVTKAELMRPKHLVKYRYIDILKGIYINNFKDHYY